MHTKNKIISVNLCKSVEEIIDIVVVIYYSQMHSKGTKILHRVYKE